MLQKKYRALWRKPWLMRRHQGSLNSVRHRKTHSKVTICQALTGIKLSATEASIWQSAT